MANDVSQRTFDRLLLFFFFFNGPATSEIYTLSLHDALPILELSINGKLKRGWRNGGQSVSITLPREPRAMETDCPDRKSTRLNSSHVEISYAVFCLKKKKRAIDISKDYTL